MKQEVKLTKLSEFDIDVHYHCLCLSGKEEPGPSRDQILDEMLERFIGTFKE